MTSERTVEKVTKMAPVGVRSNGVLQFRGHLNRERWGNFEGHGFVGWGRKSRPVVVLSSRIFSAVCTRIGSRAFPRQIGEGKKNGGACSLPGSQTSRHAGWDGRGLLGPCRDPPRGFTVFRTPPGKGGKRVEPTGTCVRAGEKTRLGLNQRWVTCRAHRVGTVIVEGRTDGN